jgi:hypothetical protein
LQETILKAALKALDWAKLKGQLDQQPLDASAIAYLCELIRHETDLLNKYPNPSREAGRTALFDALSTHLAAGDGGVAHPGFAAERQLIAQIEHGYHGILGQLQQSPIADLPAEARVNAVLERSYFEFDAVQQQFRKATEGQKELNLLSSPRLPDDKGGTYSPDAAFTALCETTAMALVMECYKNKWLHDGVVEVPMLAPVDQAAVNGASVTQMLAVIWRHWENTEKRRRFLGGDLVERRPPDVPPGTPPHFSVLYQYYPPEDGWSDLEVYDLIANIRMQDRHEQNFFDMEVEARISANAVGIAGGAKLAPAECVSADEMHAIVSLCQALHYDVAKDDAEPAGLRLAEWVRGYAVLKEIARESTKDASDSHGYHLVVDRHAVQSQLTACGLSPCKAERFVDLVSLHKAARDMFDCPLVRVGPSQLLVFTPALLHLNIVQALLSNLANRRVQLSRKGNAFEIAMREFFGKQGLKVASFKARRDGEEYEYDVVVAWQGYLFLFECKNRSLSLNDPVAAYYFDREARSAAHQVTRLANALVQYPDIVETNLGAECKDWTVVPCVLHSLPYSRAGVFEDVYFTDASALTRFFGEPYFRIKAPFNFGKITVLHRTAIQKLWKGDKPAAKDLIALFDKPHQVLLAGKHLQSKGFGFELSATAAGASVELYRTQYTTRSICEAVGCDPDEVERIIADHAKLFAETRKKLEAEGKL